MALHSEARPHLQAAGKERLLELVWALPGDPSSRVSKRAWQLTAGKKTQAPLGVLGPIALGRFDLNFVLFSSP